MCLLALQGVWVLVASVTSTRVHKGIMKKLGIKGGKKRADKKKTKNESIEVLFLLILAVKPP